MKYAIVLLSEASKLDFAGSEKLTKTDHVVIIYVKGKKTVSAALKETLDGLKATIDYYEIAKSTDAWLSVAYLMGYHAASKHDVYVITADKTKIPNKLVGDAHVYTSFKSIAGSSATTKTSTKSTTKKTTKSTTTKKTTAKKTTTKKSTSSKKKETTVMDVIGSIASGDTKNIQKGISDLAGQLLGGKS